MEQRINRTTLGITLGIILCGFFFGLVVIHYVFKPSLGAELLGGGAVFLFMVLSISSGLLRLHGKSNEIRGGRRWVAGLVIGPLGLGISALIGGLARQLVTGIVVGGIIFMAASLYFFIGPRPKA